MALITKGVKKAAARRGTGGAGGGGPPVVPQPPRFGGMTEGHFSVFKDIARDTKRIIAVRNTNPLSTKWIERRFPAKPMEIKIKTSKTTGIVTAAGEEVMTARSKGYYVVDADGVARNAKGEALALGTPEWPVEPGQVISAAEKKPLVGDYDLLGVIDPGAKGRNLVLAAGDGKRLDDWSNPDVRRVAQEFLARTGERRVMHGAHDGFATVDTAGPATLFFPDGTTRGLNTAEEVAEFYRAIGRKSVADPVGY